MKKLAISLSSVMMAGAVVLAGCSKDNGGNAADSPSPAASAGANADASAAPAQPAGGPLVKYDPPISISMSVDVNGSVEYPPGQSFDDNIWIDYYKEQLGIDVKYKWTTPTAQYFDKMNVSVASNDLADFSLVNSSQLKQLADAGQLEDMTPLLEQYLSPHLKELYDSSAGQTALASAKIDGKLMAFPVLGGLTNPGNMLWINNNWLKKLNLTPPTTMEELLDIAKAFAKDDPDGDGKADTFGLGIQQNLAPSQYGIYPMMYANHAYPDVWIKDDSGKLVYGSIQPGVRQALQTLQQMYKDGLLDKEFGVKNTAKIDQDVISGKIGMFFGAPYGGISPLKSAFANDPDTDWDPYAIVSADSEPVLMPVTVNVPQLFAVKKGTPHPEAVIQLANLYYETFYYSTPEVYSQYAHLEVDDGKGGKKYIQAFFLAPVRPSDPQANTRVPAVIEEVQQSGDESKLTPGEATSDWPAIKSYLADPKNPQTADGWGLYKSFGPKGSNNQILLYNDNHQTIVNEFYGPTTETMAKNNATLVKMEAQVFTNIIMGAPITDFDKFVSDWKSLGGDQITQEVNDWYSQQNK